MTPEQELRFRRAQYEGAAESGRLARGIAVGVVLGAVAWGAILATLAVVL